MKIFVSKQVSQTFLQSFKQTSSQPQINTFKPILLFEALNIYSTSVHCVAMLVTHISYFQSILNGSVGQYYVLSGIIVLLLLKSCKYVLFRFTGPYSWVTKQEMSLKPRLAVLIVRQESVRHIDCYNHSCSLESNGSWGMCLEKPVFFYTWVCWC